MAEKGRLLTVAAASRQHKLPVPKQAIKSSVIRVPGLLSRAEVAKVKSLAGELSPKGLHIRRLDLGWLTRYLHTDALFSDKCSQIRLKLLNAFRAVDRSQGWGFCADSDGEDDFELRTVELHTYSRFGGLPQPLHYDFGSCATIDVCLARSFEGIGFLTLEANGEFKQHRSKFVEEGDALIFLSHKLHTVAPVISVSRAALSDEMICNL